MSQAKRGLVLSVADHFANIAAESDRESALPKDAIAERKAPPKQGSRTVNERRVYANSRRFANAWRS
jgi:hypothetical protein